MRRFDYGYYDDSRKSRRRATRLPSRRRRNRGGEPAVEEPVVQTDQSVRCVLRASVLWLRHLLSVWSG